MFPSPTARGYSTKAEPQPPSRPRLSRGRDALETFRARKYGYPLRQN
jgi:hypothetical protein